MLDHVDYVYPWFRLVTFSLWVWVIFVTLFLTSRKWSCHAMLGYVCHIEILSCIHHIKTKGYIQHIATFGNVSHIMMLVYLCHIATMRLCSSHRDDKAMFITLGG
jgi:hypothetical protein